MNYYHFIVCLPHKWFILSSYTSQQYDWLIEKLNAILPVKHFIYVPVDTNSFSEILRCSPVPMICAGTSKELIELIKLNLNK